MTEELLPDDLAARLPGASWDASPPPPDPAPHTGYAAWFPDPTMPDGLRYYDGSRWTQWVWEQPPATDRSAWSYTATMLHLAGADAQLEGAPGPDVPPVGAPRARAIHGYAVLPLLVGLALLVYLPAAAIPAFLALVLLAYLWPKYNVVADLPTVDAAGAHLGLCEFQGTVEPLGPPVFGWCTGRPQVMSVVMVERQVTTHRNSPAQRGVWMYAAGQPTFWLRSPDGSRILVDLSDHPIHEEWQETQTVLVAEIEHAGEEGVRFEVTERGLPVRSPLYVLGPVQMAADGTLVVSPATLNPAVPPHDTTFIVSLGDQRDVLRAGRNSVLLLLAQALIFAFLTGVGLTRNAEDPIALWPWVAAVVLALAGVALVTGWLWRTWNRLVAIRWRVQSAWSLIAIAANRRQEVIAGLNSAARGAMDHERGVFLAAASRLHTPTEDEATELFASLGADQPVAHRAEAVPELRGDVTTARLMGELAAAENQISACRRFYNDAAVIARTRVEVFPTSVLARFAIGRPPPLLPEVEDWRSTALPSPAPATASADLSRPT